MESSHSGHQSAPWPYRLLDVPGLRARGWRPVPLQAFVLKIHQLCNLACDYCYVYTKADQSWRYRPAVMPDGVWRAAADRIAEHAAEHRLPEVTVVLHGGEPLMAGTERIAAITKTVRGALPAGTTARLALQTNGVLLTETVLDTLRDLGIRVGVSLDGTGANHDRHRRHVDGRGSFAEVQRALGLLRGPRYRGLFSGILATIDPSTDPVASYEALLEYDPPSIDFLLPHANWSAPHPAATPDGTPFGDWLVRLFDRWYGAPYQETRIRFLEELIHLVLGGASHTQELGLSPACVAVVETDGAIEQVDFLKATYEGAAATGLSVLRDSFDEALANPGMIARQIGLQALSDACRSCELHRVCGGGQYAHRYREGEGFRNRSVYCADLAAVITHVQRRVHDDLAARERSLPPQPADRTQLPVRTAESASRTAVHRGTSVWLKAGIGSETLRKVVRSSTAPLQS